MNLLFPFFALLFGFFLGNQWNKLKFFLSKILTWVFIPIVIVYNFLNFNIHYFKLILFSFIASVFLFVAYFLGRNDRLAALCFSYSNIGWLGLPVAVTIFGENASIIMISLYVGGSIFGNTLGILVLSQHQSDLRKTIIQLLQSPPIFAIYCFLVLRYTGLYFVIQGSVLDHIYYLAKIGMTFCGLCVLGMWLRNYHMKWRDLQSSLWSAIMKFILGGFLCWLFYRMNYSTDLITENIWVFFLLFLLPPAANIVALETAYLGSGRSAQLIGSGTLVSLLLIFIYYVIMSYMSIM